MASTTTFLIDELILKRMSDEGRGCLLDALATKAELPREQVKQAMKSGALWLTSSVTGSISGSARSERMRRLQRHLRAGDQLTLYFNAEVLAQRCPDATLVEDCGDYSVWIKPAGMLCQGSRWGDHTTLQRWIATRAKFDRPVYMMHRLDKMTEGLIIVTHTKRANKAFARMFEGREIEKVYQAICVGMPILELPYRIEMPIEGRPAITIVRSVQPARQLICRSWQEYQLRSTEHDKNAAKSRENRENWGEGARKFSLVTVSIETGRKHQIREHLASINCPVLGDRLINRQAQLDVDTLVDGCNQQIDLQLKATELKFLCPLSRKDKHYKIQ